MMFAGGPSPVIQAKGKIPSNTSWYVERKSDLLTSTCENKLKYNRNFGEVLELATIHRQWSRCKQVQVEPVVGPNAHAGTCLSECFADNDYHIKDRTYHPPNQPSADSQFILKKCMWIPPFQENEDRFHQIFLRCDHCKPLKKSCQYYGHMCPETICLEQKLKTIQDRPVCEYPECPKQDFLKPTHNLYQTFCDENSNRFPVFFPSVEKVESFFRYFPANQCLENDVVWCKFSAIIHYHNGLLNCGETKMIEITLKKEKISFGRERFVYVSGFLPAGF